MNLHITIPDDRAKEFDAACGKESREAFAQRAVLAALRAPAKQAVQEPEPTPAPVAKAEPKDKKG